MESRIYGHIAGKAGCCEEPGTIHTMELKPSPKTWGHGMRKTAYCDSSWN